MIESFAKGDGSRFFCSSFSMINASMGLDTSGDDTEGGVGRITGFSDHSCSGFSAFPNRTIKADERIPPQRRNLENILCTEELINLQKMKCKCDLQTKLFVFCVKILSFYAKSLRVL